MSTPYFLELKIFFDRYLKTRIEICSDEICSEFEIIPDSGSSMLIVTGLNCSTCDKRDGQWPSSPNTEETDNFSYGGGQESAVTISTGLLNKSIPIRFGIIEETKSISDKPENVFGLICFPNDYNSLENSLPSSIAQVYFDFISWRLILASSNYNLIPNNIKKYRLERTEDKYCLPISSFSIRTEQNKIYNYNNITRVLFDTGSNYTMFPEDTSFSMFYLDEPSIVSIKTRDGELNFNWRFVKRTCFYPNTIIIGLKWFDDRRLYFNY